MHPTSQSSGRKSEWKERREGVTSPEKASTTSSHPPKNMSTQIGSVFLGDVQRQRILSPTPPSSPDPATSKRFVPAKQSPTLQKPPAITPQLSLELRLSWLEALLYGVRQKDRPLAKGETLLRNAQQIQRRLDDIVQNNDSLRKFMDQCTSPSAPPSTTHLTVSTRTDDQYAHLLTLSGIIPNALPSYENMTPSEFETFLQEMEPDIRAADRDMREIEALDQKGVAAVGKLTSACPAPRRLCSTHSRHQPHRLSNGQATHQSASRSSQTRRGTRSIPGETDGRSHKPARSARKSPSAENLSWSLSSLDLAGQRFI